MRLRSKSDLFIFISCFSFGLNVFAQEKKPDFRTPARMYAGAYSVKIQLKKDLTEYDVPVWIKPDVEESALDPLLLRDLGYVEESFSFDEVKFAIESLAHKNFKAQKTEWAFVPDFPKSCCFGVIGRDILRNFRIRFDPRPPAHLEWTRIESGNESKTIKPSFLADLKKLFSLREAMEVPVVLDLQERTLVFEAKPEKLDPTLFSFFFVPPERVIQVTTIRSSDQAGAKKAGLRTGLVIVEINGKKVSGLDRWEIEQTLRGKRAENIRLLSKNNRTFTYDFSEKKFLTE